MKQKIVYIGKMIIVVAWGLIVTMAVALTVGCAAVKEPAKEYRDVKPLPKRIRYADTPSTFSSGYYQYCPHHHNHPIMK